VRVVSDEAGLITNDKSRATRYKTAIRFEEIFRLPSGEWQRDPPQA